MNRDTAQIEPWAGILPESISRTRSIQHIEKCLELGLATEAWQALERLAETDRADASLLVLRVRVYLAAGMRQAAAAVAEGLVRAELSDHAARLAANATHEARD